MAVNAEQLKRLLGLEPLPIEGGYYTRTYRSDIAVPGSVLPERYQDARPSEGTRRISTVIYFLLTADTFSAMHRLASDEIYHFYLGDPVELLVLEANGRGEVTRLGQDIEAGMRVQAVVPGGTWQGSRPAAIMRSWERPWHRVSNGGISRPVTAKRWACSTRSFVI